MIRIVKSEFIKSAVKPDQYPATGFAEFAFVGRSNVGKSSLLNAVLNRRSLAKVSGQPGKTRLINFFQIQYKQKEEDGVFTMVDLPGYGFAKVSKAEREKWNNMVTDYFASRLQLKAVFVLVDIRHKADPKDIDVIQMLKSFDKSCCIIATKSDKIAVGKHPNTLKQLKAGLGLDNQQLIPFSSPKKRGVDNILSWLESQLT